MCVCGGKALWRGRTLNGLSFVGQDDHPFLKMKSEAEAETAVLMATQLCATRTFKEG